MAYRLSLVYTSSSSSSSSSPRSSPKSFPRELLLEGVGMVVTACSGTFMYRLSPVGCVAALLLWLCEGFGDERGLTGGILGELFKAAEALKTYTDLRLTKIKIFSHFEIRKP